MIALLPGFPAGIECVVRGKICVPSVLRLSRGEFEVVVWEGESEWRLRVDDDDVGVDANDDKMNNEEIHEEIHDNRMKKDMMIDDGLVDSNPYITEINSNNANDNDTNRTSNDIIIHHPILQPTNQTLLSAIQLPRFHPFHLIGFFLDVIQTRGNDRIFIQQPQRDEIAQISVPPSFSFPPRESLVKVTHLFFDGRFIRSQQNTQILAVSEFPPFPAIRNTIPFVPSIFAWRQIAVQSIISIRVVSLLDETPTLATEATFSGMLECQKIRGIVRGPAVWKLLRVPKKTVEEIEEMAGKKGWWGQWRNNALQQQLEGKEWERREKEFLREQMECSMEEKMEGKRTVTKQAPNGARFLWEDPEFVGVEGGTVLVDMNRSIGDVMMLSCTGCVTNRLCKPQRSENKSKQTRWKEIADAILLYEVENPLFVDVIDVEWKDTTSQLFELLSFIVC